MVTDNQSTLPRWPAAATPLARTLPVQSARKRATLALRSGTSLLWLIGPFLSLSRDGETDNQGLHWLRRAFLPEPQLLSRSRRHLPCFSMRRQRAEAILTFAQMPPNNPQNNVAGERACIQLCESVSGEPSLSFSRLQLLQVFRCSELWTCSSGPDADVSRVCRCLLLARQQRRRHDRGVLPQKHQLWQYQLSRHDDGGAHA
jgi:hypothetical protein